MNLSLCTCVSCFFLSYDNCIFYIDSKTIVNYHTYDILSIVRIEGDNNTKART